MHSKTHFYGMGVNVILHIPLFYTYIFLYLELNRNFTILYNINFMYFEAQSKLFKTFVTSLQYL